MLQTEGATLSGVIDSQKISELPLNGRNFVQLALLVPGVNTGQPGAGRGGGISINGTRSEQNSFQLDGVTNTNQWDAGISFRPSVDSIQEFRIEVSSYAAEFGRGAGGQISVVTKSGTNDLHGTAYEFNRNDRLQARNFFDRNPNFVDKNGKFKPPPLNRNEFGMVLGGPIIRGKTFFFGDYQGRRQVRGSVARRTVPNAALSRGDLSSLLGAQIGTDLLGRPVLRNQIYNPRTSRLITNPATGRQVFIRDPYPNNQIPLSDFDPIALKILQSGLWPAPNADGTRDANTGNPRDNFFDNRPNETFGDQFFARIDHQFSSNNSIFARYGLSDSETRDPGSFPGNERLSVNRQQVFAVSHTKVFGSSMVNELRFGYTRERPENGAIRILEGQNLVKELGIRGLPLAGPGAPNITITGFTGISDGGELRRSDDTYQLVEHILVQQRAALLQARRRVPRHSPRRRQRPGEHPRRVHLRERGMDRHRRVSEYRQHVRELPARPGSPEIAAPRRPFELPPCSRVGGVHSGRLQSDAEPDDQLRRTLSALHPAVRNARPYLGDAGPVLPLELW